MEEPVQIVSLKTKDNIEEFILENMDSRLADNEELRNEVLKSETYKQALKLYKSVSMYGVSEKDNKIYYDLYTSDGIIIYSSPNKDKILKYFEILED